MIYTALKSSLLRLLKAPQGPPDPPAGSHDSVEVFRASPRFLLYRLLHVLVGLALMLVLISALALVGLLKQEPAPAVVAGLIALVVLPISLLVYFLTRVDYDLRFYVVSDRSLRVREGAWTVREMTITYANVQNLRVVQGPLMRLFGIWHLRVDVAGGGTAQQPGKQESGHHVTLAGIADAAARRDQIRAWLRAARAGGGLGDPDDAQPGSAALPGTPAVLAALEQLAGAAAALASTARR